MVKLRPYQEKLLREAEEALSAPDARVMLQLPTGGGKTRIAAALLAGWVRSGGKAAWLTHRRELSDQTGQELNKLGVPAVSRPQWDKGDPAPAISGCVVILTTQTVSTRNRDKGVWGEYGPKDLLVVDEAHHAPARGWKRAIEQWPGQVIGLTATPWRLAKQQGFNHLFNKLIPGPQVKDLQWEKHLAYAQVLMPADSDLMDGGIPARTGEYLEREMERLNEGRHIWTAGAVEFWQKHAKGHQTIVYAVSVAHAKKLATVFNDDGILAAEILGATNRKEEDARRRNIRRFSDGELKVLVNVEVATEGFDLPDVSCVVLARPTMSLALYLQMVGRGLRPDGGGDCLILDLAGNVKRHGFPDKEREWLLEQQGQQGQGGPPSIVRCPDCEGVSPAGKHSCQFCEYPFGKICQNGRCGLWRAWKDWSEENYCRNDHDLVCNWCHPDAHKRARLPLQGELREALKEVLMEQWSVNPSELHSLGEVQAQIREMAKELAFTHDQATFNHLTKQLDSLIKRQSQMRTAFLKEIREKMGDNHRDWINFIEKRDGKMDELTDFGQRGGVYFLRWRGIARAMRITESGMEMWDHFGDMGSAKW